MKYSHGRRVGSLEWLLSVDLALLPARVTVSSAPSSTPSPPALIESASNTVQHLPGSMPISKTPTKPQPHSRTPSLYSKLLHLFRQARVPPRINQNTMPPTIGPELASDPTLGPFRPTAVAFSRSSTTSSHTSAASVSSSPAYSSSSLSIPFEDGDVDVVRVEGLRHAPFRLEAR